MKLTPVVLYTDQKQQLGMGNGASTLGGALPPAPPPRPGSTLMNHSAALLARSFTQDGADVDIPKFLVAGSAFLAFVTSLGMFAKVASGAIKDNLMMIKAPMDKNTDDSAGSSTSSMRSLLLNELSNRLHENNTLKPNSAAFGLYWIIRALRFWEFVCNERARLAVAADAPRLKDTLDLAYETALTGHSANPYDRSQEADLSHAAFKASLALAPEWDALLPKLLTAGGTDDEFVAEVEKFSPLMSKSVQQLTDLFEEHFAGWRPGSKE